MALFHRDGDYGSILDFCGCQKRAGSARIRPLRKFARQPRRNPGMSAEKQVAT
jgi:hypothetical protein